MTRAEAEKTAKFALAWQKRLRLQDWSIDYTYHASGELPSDLAEGACLAGCARVWPEFETAEVHAVGDSPDAPATYFVRHELLHVLLSPMLAAVRRLEDQVAPAVFAMALDEYVEAEERAIRRLDDAFEEFDATLPEEE